MRKKHKIKKNETNVIYVDENDVKVSMIQMLIPLGLEAVKAEMEKELIELVGERYSRSESNYHRWGYNKGSVYLGDQKVKIDVPRIRDKEAKKFKSLQSYEFFQSPRLIDESIFTKVLYGLSQKRFEKAAISTAESFGISKSSVSRRFIKSSSHRLGVFKQLGISLKTTNCMESLFSQVANKTDRGDNWKNSNQRQRWVVSSLLEIGKDLRKIKGYRHLHLLKEKMKQDLQKQPLKNVA